MTPRTLEIAALREPLTHFGRLAKKLIAVFLFFLAASAARANTYYIDYASGSNSNAGTKVSPWKTHPYMQTGSGCTGGVTGWGGWTHAAGDQYIFKGGLTWPAACFEMYVKAGGTSQSTVTNGGQTLTLNGSDYYGVDKTWYAGGSWTRPIFDMANAIPTSVATSNDGTDYAFIDIAAKYVAFDNIEMKRMAVKPNVGDCQASSFDMTGVGGATFDNMYIHDWSLASFTPGSIGIVQHGTASICQNNGPSNTVYNTTMSDQATTSMYPFGACWRNLNEVAYSSCTYTGEVEVGVYGDTHDDEMAHGTSNNSLISWMCPSGPSTCNPHMNVFEFGSGAIYNDFIHDNGEGVTIHSCLGQDIYNNVMYNNTSISLVIIPHDAQCFQGSTDPTYIYDNTIDCSNGNYCLYTGTAVNTYGPLHMRNNIWVTNGTPTCYNTSSCGSFSDITDVGNNHTMSTTEAATYGINASSKYKPGVSDPNVSGQGLNLSSSCTGSFAALCQDATGAPWFGGSYITRPTGSTGWDLGAYQGQGGGGTGPPTVTITSPAAGTVSGTKSLTLTCTPQGTATCASAQFTIDGFSFGSAGTSFPYTLNWDTTTAANASHIIGASATDSNNQVGTAGTVTVTVSNSIPGCFISTDNDSGALSWTANQSFTAQTTNFTATFTATPNTNNQNSVIALSENAMTAYSQGAALVRFNSAGDIDVYNGTLGNYASDNTAPYTAGTAYSFTSPTRSISRDPMRAPTASVKRLHRASRWPPTMPSARRP